MRDRARSIPVSHRVGGQFALAPLALRLRVHRGEVAAVVLEDLELALPLGETVVVDLFGRELAVDPAHHPIGSHAPHIAGSRSVREAVQGVERRVLGSEGGLLRRDTDREDSERQDRPNDPRFHAVILTHSPWEKLRS